MSRITDAILGQKSFGRDATQPMLDLTYGGQFGYAPRLTEWVSNQAYVRKNLFAILLEAPRFFQLMPDPQKWVAVLKSLIELHPKTIEGLNAGIKLETDTHNVGGAGELQDEVIDSKRDRSEPVFTYVEKYGKPIQTFLQQWIQYGIMDPDTKYPLIGTLTGQKPDDMLADWYSCSVLFVEPDPTHRKVVQSWVVTNMFPKGTGDIAGKRDLTSASEVLNLSIEFTGIAQTGLGTNVFAQKILDAITLDNANPYLRPSMIDKITSDVEAATVGYQSTVTDLGKSAIVTG
jgi:hypothetical protein